MLDTVQLYAGLVVLRKTPFALRFLREWLAWATEGALITDAWQPARQHAGFQQHRHDQSILSLLAKRHRLKTFPLPTAAHDRRDIWARVPVRRGRARASAIASWLRLRSAGAPEPTLSARSCPRLPRASASLGQCAAWGRADTPAIQGLFST